MAKAAKPVKQASAPQRGVKQGAKKAAAKSVKHAAPVQKGVKKALKKAAPVKRTATKTPAKKAAPVKKVVKKQAVPVKKAMKKKAAPVKKVVKKAPAPKSVAKRVQKSVQKSVKKAAPKKAAAATTAPEPVAPKRARPTATELIPKAARKPGSVICPLSGFEVVPQKPNLSERTIERLRTHLTEERERHLRQADDLAAEAEALAHERDQGDTQFDEESGEGDTVNVERERDLLLSASARQTVEQVDAALARMDAGTYGLCVPAGRRIAVERLDAIPYAEECVDCKARAERRR